MFISKQPHDKVIGYWCRTDRIFYYLESGDINIADPLHQIQRSLLSKGLFSFVKETLAGAEPLVKMTWAEAEEKKYEVKPIYISLMVKNKIEKEMGQDHLCSTSTNPWKED